MFAVYTPAVDISVYNYPWYYLDAEQEYEDTYVVGNVPGVYVDCAKFKQS